MKKCHQFSISYRGWKIAVVYCCVLIFPSLLQSCTSQNQELDSTSFIISEKTAHDTDDPAIWYNEKDVSKSIVFGTDKNVKGAVYAFDLSGKIIEDKMIRDLAYPNNLDVEYAVSIDENTKVDILVITERDKHQIRIFSIPDMKPLDNGGLKVFEDTERESFKLPMGIGIYKSPKDGSVYIIVSRKNGPKNNYLYQYKLLSVAGKFELYLIRKFGEFSEKKEIESIAVDDELGFIYYSDETFGIRKYFAEPTLGNKEVFSFGKNRFKGDSEGITIIPEANGTGYIIVSNQQNNSFSIFTRDTNEYIKEVDLGIKETDGCEFSNLVKNNMFTKGLFVAMNNEKNFYFFDFEIFGLE